MSLQGSIETFALPDVLGLLASTKKSGELRIVATNLDGSVWFSQGQLVQTVVGGRDLKPADAVFELLRLVKGTFAFEADHAAPKPGQPQAVTELLAAAQAALVEWKEIAKVVPDVDHVVSMAPEPPLPEVTVFAEQWTLLVAVAGGRSVRDLMARLDRSEFETCKAVKGLIDAGLAVLAAAPKAEPAPAKQTAAAAAAAAGTNGRSAQVDAAKAAATKVGLARGGQEGDRDVAANRQGWSSSPKLGPTSEKAGKAPAAPAAAGAAAASGADKADPTSTPDAQALVAQLAALAGDDEEVVAEQVAAHLAEGGELPAVADASEPINRGLLLKFLSSVRN